jgi:MFS family permease
VVTGLLMGLTATLGNGLVTVNISNLQGALALDPVQGAWLQAIYVAANACANLLLVKARIQFGIPPVTIGLLGLCAAAALVRLLAPGFASEIALRAASGATAAGLSTMTIYSMLQAAPPQYRQKALAFGVGIPQLGVPLARLFPPEWLALHHWRALDLFEFGLVLVALAAVLLSPLPPNERRKAFEPLDFVSIALVVPAVVLVCGALGVGRTAWWTDAPWIGVMLAVAVPLFCVAAWIGLHRTSPLIDLRWLGSRPILRFAAIAFLVRISLAEQTYGAVGLLTYSGLTNEQLRILFAIVSVVTVAGITLSALILTPGRLRYQVLFAVVLIGVAGWMDSHANNLTRPAQLYFSQALTAFGAALFIGPALVYGFSRMLERGPEVLISLLILFNITQNVGSLAGSALLGSFQVLREKVHSQAIVEHLTLTNPVVADRVRSGGGAVAGAVGDPLLRNAEGVALLGQAARREANILAYNDVFRAVTVVAALTALYLVFLIVRDAAAKRREAAAATAGATP